MLGSLGGKKRDRVTPGIRCAEQLSDFREVDGPECIPLDIVTSHSGLGGGHRDQLGQVSHQISTHLNTFKGETMQVTKILHFV